MGNAALAPETVKAKQNIANTFVDPNAGMPLALDLFDDQSGSQGEHAVAPNINRDELKEAFTLFNQMSQQLSASYEFLESKVEELSGELATESQQRLNELAEKERIADRLESLLHMLPGGVVLIDGEGLVKECNPAAQQLLSIDDKAVDLIGRPWRDIIQTIFQPQPDDGHDISLVDGRRVNIQTASLGSEPGQIVLMTDQTETRQLQERLSQHQRLSAMGKMVASLAHQIRTPLSAAMIYAEHLKADHLSEEQHDKFSEKLLQRLHHLEHQVRDMLIFARGDSPLNDEMSLRALIKEWQLAMEMPLEQHGACCEFHLCHQSLANNLQSNVEGIVNIEGIRVQCNKDALIGALMNLINNAIEAVESMPNNVKPQLMVNVRVDEKYQVTIEIEDNGPGLEKNFQEKVSEAFYTTKSNGTGLGLSVVQAVARAHYGEFALTSADKKSRLGGALARLSFPANLA